MFLFSFACVYICCWYNELHNNLTSNTKQNPENLQQILSLPFKSKYSSTIKLYVSWIRSYQIYAKFMVFIVTYRFKRK